MTLGMRGSSGRCHGALARNREAYIRVFECAFCTGCADALQRVCPDCGGGLGRRPGPEPQPVALGQAVA